MTHWPSQTDTPTETATPTETPTNTATPTVTDTATALPTTVLLVGVGTVLLLWLTMLLPGSNAA